MTLYTLFTQHLHEALDALEAAGTLPAGLDRGALTVEPPRDPAHGDLATNAAMVLAKPAGTNPRALAEAIAVELLDPQLEVGDQRLDSALVGHGVGGQRIGTTAERSGTVADRVGRITCCQRIVTLHQRAGFTIGIATGLELPAGLLRSGGYGIELVLVDRIVALCAIGHVGDLAGVAAAAHRYGVVAVRNRIRTERHAVGRARFRRIAQRGAVDAPRPGATAHRRGVVARGFGRQHAEQRAADGDAVGAGGQAALAGGGAGGVLRAHAGGVRREQQDS